MNDKELATSESVTLYALVRNGKLGPLEAYGIIPLDGVNDGYPQWDLTDWESDPPYEDCDYGGLSGLLVFHGELWTKTEAWSAVTEDERDAWRDAHNVWMGEYDAYYEGSWSRMTAAEVATLGLITPGLEAQHG